MYKLLIVVLTLTCKLSIGCQDNCSFMAGTQCRITDRCNFSLPGSGEFLEYPDLPRDVKILTLPGKYGDIPGQNITWIYNGSGTTLQGFRIISRRLSKPDEETCLVYDIDGEIKPDSIFFYDCSRRSYYYEISSLPQKNGQMDYIHRIVNVFNQTHDENTTVFWSPNLAIIHNDSCRAMIELTFDAPPPAYGFKDIVVELKEGKNVIENKIVRLNSSLAEVSFIFHDVPDGQYLFYIFHNLDEHYAEKGQCTCKIEGVCASGCGYSNTSEFLINASHPKCQSPTSEQPPENETYVPPKPESNLVLIYIAVIGSTVLILLVAIVLVYTNKVRTNQQQNSEGTLSTSVFHWDSDSFEKSLHTIGRSISQVILPTNEKSDIPTVVGIKEVNAKKKQEREQTTVKEQSAVTSYVDPSRIKNIEDAEKRLEGDPLVHKPIQSNFMFSDVVSSVITVPPIDTSSNASKALNEHKWSPTDRLLGAITHSLDDGVLHASPADDSFYDTSMLLPGTLDHPNNVSHHGNTGNRTKISTNFDGYDLYLDTLTTSSVNSDLPQGFEPNVPTGKKQRRHSYHSGISA